MQRSSPHLFMGHLCRRTPEASADWLCPRSCCVTALQGRSAAACATTTAARRRCWLPRWRCCPPPHRSSRCELPACQSRSDNRLLVSLEAGEATRHAATAHGCGAVMVPNLPTGSVTLCYITDSTRWLAAGGGDRQRARGGGVAGGPAAAAGATWARPAGGGGPVPCAPAVARHRAGPGAPSAPATTMAPPQMPSSRPSRCASGTLQVACLYAQYATVQPCTA